ncbi:putative 2og-fe oxygenase protein [Venustampulla echinocandica]|uniref:Putative 2og-fe oxygenase protein n=1 Tax=Venustampulla echinocandica TaxID=2656787 RepID=A0A370T8X5_9HELO|nr:putative 2og-fe oxygenase protein [Venustampulla echinocandica]RDL29936.1 putative 2og-fe oxygenase protein [Venustampulla echinocandica]
MPSVTLSPYKQIPETKEDLDWAELTTLHLDDLDQPGGKDKLAKQLEYAIHNVGFFYVKNFGISQEEVNRQFALGREFYDLPLEEKLKYHNLKELEGGNFNGYRPSGLRTIGTIKDNIEVYNIPKFDGYHPRTHPKVVEDHIQEIEKFSRDVHEKVVVRLLRVFATLLELPDQDQLVKDHAYNEKGEDHLRYMHYKARTPEENEGVGKLYGAGHTDLGTITLLFRQPVAGLQILNSEDQWKWVKPQDATITVNICDALSALTAGYFKSSIHRVHAPPSDQAHIDRLGLLYFARPNNHVILNPIANSPLLHRLDLKSNNFTDLGKTITMEEWVLARQRQQQRRIAPTEVSKEGKYIYHEKDLEVLPGLATKIY